MKIRAEWLWPPEFFFKKEQVPVALVGQSVLGFSLWKAWVSEIDRTIACGVFKILVMTTGPVMFTEIKDESQKT